MFEDLIDCKPEPHLPQYIARRRILREIAILSKLEHENIAFPSAFF